ncbi:MAG TPA: histidine kinase [Candidatus Limnocylindrales bacterium]
MDESGTMQPPVRRRVPAILFDAALGAALAAATLVMMAVGLPESEGRRLTWLDALVAVAVFGLVLLRRRWPVPVLTVSVVLIVAAIAWDVQPEAFAAPTVIAVYTVAAHTNRVTAWIAGAASGIAVYGAVVAWSGEGWFGPPLGVVAWIGMAAAVGDAARTRRAYVAAVEERARRAEQTREEEARRRVAEERVRIARDLHDVVAHHIAVINVHAGLAEHSVRAKPDQAEASLAHVRQAAQTVLDELATILAVLRQTGDPDAPTDPVRGLSQLGELLESMAAAGLRVEHHQSGDTRPLPAAVDHAAYRIVQEALTNAHKHGSGGIADLRIEYLPEAVAVNVDNPMNPNPADSTGHGLTGMRERAIAVGGSLTAGRRNADRFNVRAILPYAARPEGAQ